jgi:hypothetical protein
VQSRCPRTRHGCTVDFGLGGDAVVEEAGIYAEEEDGGVVYLKTEARVSGELDSNEREKPSTYPMAPGLE